MNGMEDGGGRMTYDGGALREPPTGKGRYDLISPFALERLAKWHELGAKKYADRNWEKGMSYSRLIDAALRHINRYRMGQRGEDHLAAAAWNLFAYMHYQACRMEKFNDVPTYPEAQPIPTLPAKTDPYRRDYRIIAVDFDGCLCANAWPEIGEANLGAIGPLLHRQDKGDKIILWTCREGKALQEALDWCARFGLKFDAVNANLPEMNAMYSNDSRKIGADEYWDDKAVNVVAGGETK